ncbi:amidohydrolase family protein [Desertibacillus haloalkaliphilus]|uniref:amidohydrolase family protein n=1 Tax=Desertibacillus haloalkaliphilus TaxID=1328930 RepID=UPI001C2756D3|nr:amidohydrolase family protein [Desertibacillus haloalkaliphilus]MBU8906241.1 amidohydrolase [Desertibacillus haloalkaliphilus]
MSTLVNKKDQKVVNRSKKIPVIDCDVHPNPKSYEDLNPYLSEYWRDFLADCKWKGVFPNIPAMAIVANAGHRMDSIPPEGGLGCSSLDFYREQVADRYNYANSILFPDSTFMLSASPQHEMATAIASAYNDWQIDHWLSKDSSLRGSVVIASQDPEMAAREIDRVGSHPQMAQVGLSIHSPYGGWGDNRYYPIWKAAVRHGLVCTFHVSVPGGVFRPGPNYGNYYPEFQTNNGLTYQAQISSIIFGGVFEKFTKLRMLFVEGGFAWLPSVMYTMDTHWRNLKREVPWVKRPPSQVVREHMWFGTQPMIEPESHEDEKHVLDIMKMVGLNNFVFTSDYPHWEFDAPHAAFARFPKEFKHQIFYKNAVDLFGLPNPMDTNGTN